MTYKHLGPFISKFGSWVEEWANDMASENPLFRDTLISPEQLHARTLVSGHIKERMEKVMSIINREQAGINRSAARKAARDAALAAQNDASQTLV